MPVRQVGQVTEAEPADVDGFVVVHPRLPGYRLAAEGHVEPVDLVCVGANSERKGGHPDNVVCSGEHAGFLLYFPHGARGRLLARLEAPSHQRPSPVIGPSHKQDPVRVVQHDRGDRRKRQWFGADLGAKGENELGDCHHRSLRLAGNWRPA